MAQASLKKKLLEDYLNKKAVAPLAALFAAQTASDVANLGAAGVEKVRSFGENMKVKQNPFLAPETKVRQQRRKLSNATPDAWVGGLGRNISNRKFKFAGGRSSAGSSDYNGMV